MKESHYRKGYAMLCFIRSLSFFWFLVFTILTASAADVAPVKYVFLFIGDGMSIPQRQMSEEFVRKTENRGLQINAMPYQAITTTYASDSFVTDSAAAGTAIACGEKTNNGVLGLSPEGKPYESIAAVAFKSGRKVGIITSVTLNHATPAAFYAHNASRGNAYDIGLDLVASGFDYFGGGGIAGYNDKKAKQYRGDIYDLAKEAGYTVCRTESDIRSIKRGNGKVIAVGNEKDLPYAIDVPKGGLRLADFTEQAIKLLDNPKGFFIMTEGGKIDWMCHANDAATTIHEVIEFDNAVSVAFDFAVKHPKETLIIVTGDHETGALTFGFAGTGYQIYIELLANQKASHDELEELTKKFVRENKEDAAFEKFKQIVTEKTGLVFTEEGKWKKGNMNLTKDEMRQLEKTFEQSKQAILENKGKMDVVARAMIRILNDKAGVSWASGGHSALPVNTSAFGNQAERIAQQIRDNTDIAKQLKQAVSPLVTRENNVRRTQGQPFASP